MALGKQGWLEQLIREGVTKYRADVASNSLREASALPPGVGRARRYLRGILRESGLLFGTPDAPKAGEQVFGPRVGAALDDHLDAGLAARAALDGTGHLLGLHAAGVVDDQQLFHALSRFAGSCR